MMREDASGRRQRAVMATDAEWERIGRAAASGMDLSRFVIHRALDREAREGMVERLEHLAGRAGVLDSGCP